jgi:hypothetical protein
VNACQPDSGILSHEVTLLDEYCGGWYDKDMKLIPWITKVKTIIINKVKGKDLPKEWAERAEVCPEDTVEVTIQPSRDERLRELFAAMDRVGEEAERQGLTDEKLAELLKDS